MCTTGVVPDAGLLDLLDRAAELLRTAADKPLSGGVTDLELTGAVQRLEALARMATGQKLAAVAELAEREAHRGQAARAPEDLLATTLHLSRGEAKAQAELAVGLRDLPATTDALKQGHLGVGQAQVTVRKAAEVKDRPDGAELVTKVDAYAAKQGRTVDKGRLGRGLDALVHTEAPDTLADRERRAQRARGVWFGERDGLPEIRAVLPVDGMAAVRALLDAAGKPDGAHDARTVAQRHADALVTVARRYLDEGCLPEVAGQRPHVLLVTTPEALHDTPGAQPSLLDGHGPVSNQLARQLCCDAQITAVLTAESGQVLDARPLTRRPSARQRDAVIARDRACIGCGAPTTRCEIHHIRWWCDGGRTDVSNLALVCWNCHTHIHHHGWRITCDETGRYRAGPPGMHLENFTENRPLLAHTG